MIHDVCQQAKQYLGQDDPQPVQLTLATAVSAYDNEKPVFAMFVGPSSAGKTTIITLTKDLSYTMDDPTVAGLLTVDAKGVPGGLLPAMGNRGFIVIPDFSTILAMSDRGARDLLFAHLRRIYDGETSRNLHGHRVEWQGKVTMVTACTSAIDSFSVYQNELGSRFIYFRFDSKTQQEKKDRLISARKRNLDLAGVQNIAKWTVDEARKKVKHVTLSEPLQDFLDDASIVCAYGRTSVPRQGYTHAVIAEVETEEPFRMREQLGALGKCAAALGLNEDEIANLCARIARDSMPITRRNVLKLLVSNADIPLTVAQLAKTLRANRSVIYRSVEDLHLSGLLTEVEQPLEDPPKYLISDTHLPSVSSVFNRRS